jgi:hypothetical protein
MMHKMKIAFQRLQSSVFDVRRGVMYAGLSLSRVSRAKIEFFIVCFSGKSQ